MSKFTMEFSTVTVVRQERGEIDSECAENTRVTGWRDGPARACDVGW
jgi:hypothetical protein